MDSGNNKYIASNAYTSSTKGNTGKQKTDRKKTMKHKGWGTANQDKVQYAYELGGEQFVYLLNAENGAWTYKLKHPKVPGSVGIDYGFCGTNSVHHAKTLKDKRFFTDWKWQMEQCYYMYTHGVTFYGKNNIEKQKSLFYFE